MGRECFEKEIVESEKTFMVIYIFNLLSIWVYSIFYDVLKNYCKNEKMIKTILVSLITLQMVCLLAFRDETVGVDTQGYVYKFKYIFPIMDYEQFMDYRFEIGFKILTKIISVFTENEHIYLFIIALLSIIPVALLIYKHSKLPFLSFSLYVSLNYYAFTFSGLRQAIAYGIIFISYNYICEKKIMKFALSVILASFFHKSALIFLPAYFFSNLKINKFTLFGIFILDVLVFIFSREIFLIASGVFYDSYEIVESLSINWLLLCLTIVISSMPFYRNLISISKYNNSLYVFSIIGVSIMLLAIVGTNVMRVADYYFMFVIILIPEVIYSLQDKRFAIFCRYLLVFFMLFLYLWFLNQDGFEIVPYTFLA